MNIIIQTARLDGYVLESEPPSPFNFKAVKLSKLVIQV